MDAPLPGAKPGAEAPAADTQPPAAPPTQEPAAAPESGGASDAKGWTVFMDAPPSPPPGAPGSIPQGPMEFAKPSSGPTAADSNSSMMVGGGAASVSTSGEVESSSDAESSHPTRGPSVRTSISTNEGTQAPASMEAGRAAPVADADEGGSGKTIMFVVVAAAAAAVAAALLM